MAQVVAGIACSHVPMMASPKNWEHLADGERTSLRAGFDRARQILEDSRPDILITFADDRFDRCFFENLPAFLVGVGEEAVGPAVAGFDIPKVRVPIASDLARYIVREGLEGGVDFAFSEDLKLDHAEIAPMIHLTPRWDIPMIPIVVNAFAPPMPTPKRCFDVGAFIGKCLERWPDNKRVAFLGTGGLSHCVGPPQTGSVNEELDRWVLERLAPGDISEVTTRYARYEDLEAVAGNRRPREGDRPGCAGPAPRRGLPPRVPPLPTSTCV